MLRAWLKRTAIILTIFNAFLLLLFIQYRGTDVPLETAVYILLIVGAAIFGQVHSWRKNYKLGDYLLVVDNPEAEGNYITAIFLGTFFNVLFIFLALDNKNISGFVLGSSAAVLTNYFKLQGKEGIRQGGLDNGIGIPWHRIVSYNWNKKDKQLIIKTNRFILSKSVLPWYQDEEIRQQIEELLARYLRHDGQVSMRAGNGY